MGEALIRAELKLIAREILNYTPSFSLYLRALTDDILEELSQRLTKNDMKRLAPKLDISPQELVSVYINQCRRQNNSESCQLRHPVEMVEQTEQSRRGLHKACRSSDTSRC